MMAAGMTEFVQRRPVEIDLIEERRLWRHLHIIQTLCTCLTDVRVGD